MATRLYLTAAAAPVTPAAATYGGGQVWELPASASAPAANLLARADRWPGATTFATLTSVAEAVATNAQDVAIRRYVSDPLVGAQTITGTLLGQMYLAQSATGMNALPQIMIKVVSGDGATLRGTLYGGDSRTTNVDEVTQAIRNQKNPAATSGNGAGVVTLSSVNALDGDRILVEVGVRAINTVTTSYTATHRHGSLATPGGANDLTIGGAQSTDLNSWVEFSQDLVFTKNSASAIAGIGTVTPSPIKGLPGNVAIDGVGDVAPSPVLVKRSAVTISGEGTVDPAATKQQRVYTQTRYRFRNDDGTLATATWKAAEDANVSIPMDANFRVRFQVLAEGTIVPSDFPVASRLQYSKNGGAWTNVTTSSSNVRVALSPHYAQGTTATRQLTLPPGGTYQSGRGASGAETINMFAGTVVATDLWVSEGEFALQLRSAEVSEGDQIQLRIARTSALGPFNTYAGTAEVTAVRSKSSALSIDGVGTVEPLPIVQQPSETKNSALSIDGVGTVSPLPVKIEHKLSALSIDGVSELTVVPLKALRSALTSAGIGTVEPSPIGVRRSATSISGIGTLSPAAIGVRSGALTISGIGSLTPAARLLLRGAASIDGVGTLDAVLRLHKYSALSIDGSGALAIIIGEPELKSSALSIDGSGVVLPASVLRRLSSLEIAGSSALSIVPALIKASHASVNGEGAVQPLPLLQKYAEIEIAGGAIIVPANTLVRPSTVQIDGQGTLVALPIWQEAQLAMEELRAVLGFEPILLVQQGQEHKLIAYVTHENCKKVTLGVE